MADVKISELTALTSPDGAEELVVNDSGTTKKITIEDLFAGDNVKAKFGTGDDLQIYHDGSNSLIVNDTNSLVIQNKSDDKQVIIQSDNGGGGLGDYFRADGATGETTLYHYGTAKLATKSTGVETQGRVMLSGADNHLRFNGNSSTPSGECIHRPAAANIAIVTGSAERMRIDSSGNVGIGGSPANPLHVTKEIAGYQAYFNNDNGSGQGLKVRVKANDSGNFNILDLVSASTGSDVSVMTVRDDGNVGINKTAPTAKLHIVGSNAAAVLKLSGGTTNGYYNFEVQNDAQNGYGVGFKHGGTLVGSIRTTGSATSYNQNSDYRLKTDVQPMTGATDRIKLLKPCNFEWIVDGTRVDGFIAHEAQEVVPEAVAGTKDAMRDEEYEVTPATGDMFTPSIDAYVDADENEVEAIAEVIHSADVEQPETLQESQQWRETTAAVMGTRSVPDMQGIDQSKLVPLLTATIQELIARIEALEA